MPGYRYLLFIERATGEFLKRAGIKTINNRRNFQSRGFIFFRRNFGCGGVDVSVVVNVVVVVVVVVVDVAVDNPSPILFLNRNSFRMEKKFFSSSRNIFFNLTS